MFFLETRQHHAKRKKDEEKRERKRRIAARMIAELKKDVVEYRETIKDLNEKNASLRARLSGEQETAYQLNDENNALRGIIRAYEGVIDKFMANLK